MKRVAFLIMLLCLGLTVNVAIAAPPNQEAEGQAYVVQTGDWLSKIALAYMGDVTAYPAIVEATNAKAAEDDSFAVIEDPDLIEVGQKLWIPVGTTGLTLNALRNAEYRGIYDEPVQLVDGGYEGEPFVPGSASRPIVTFVDAEGHYAFGDLNGDDIRDAAVILAENSGGSGVFIYLAAVVDQDGTPANVATQFLGDRVQLQSLEIDQGEVVVNMITQGPDDPFCCPSLEVTLRYRLEGGQLVEQPDYVGTYKALLPAASSPGRDITLNLNADYTVELSTDYLNDEAPIVEVGSWQANSDGTATVTLTGRQDGQTYDSPTVITFELTDGELVAVEYDVSLYGSEGLQLSRQ